MPYGHDQTQFKLAYEISPITLTNGIAGNIPGGMLPLMSLIQSQSFAGGIVGGGNVGLDDTFANFYPLPGTTLIQNEIGKYPFANMAVAANAIIAMPINVSMIMRAPARANLGYAQKLQIMTALQNTLKQHCASGGTFIVATPSFFFTDCILVDLADISGGESNQPQMTWKWDFQKPLVTMQDAQSVQNQMTQSLTNGTPTSGSNYGLSAQNTNSASTAGFLPASVATPSAGTPAYPSVGLWGSVASAGSSTFGVS